jgi:hypothetical protein
VAIIERHPGVADYILTLSPAEIAARGGIAELVETGHLVIVRDRRLEFDFRLLQLLSKSLDGIADDTIRRKLKKLDASYFFAGDAPIERNGRLLFDNRLRQSVYEILCLGDADLFRTTAAALRRSHDQLLDVFALACPDYQAWRVNPILSLTRTMCENLHWDEHGIEEDFHQARIFANLDSRPRIWHVSHRFTEMMEQLYVEHDLARFAGQDPNLLVRYLTSNLLGGLKRKWLDDLPRHRIAFEPGEIWIGESRLISHQIYYGESALAYMWLVTPSSMASPAHRFNAIVEAAHRRLGEAVRAAP